MLKVLTDPGREELVPLTEVPSIEPEIIPRPRGGRKLAISTVYRWATRGCRGVKLEVLRAGGTMCTTRSAVLRFYDGVTRVAPNQIEMESTRSSAGTKLAGVDRQLDEILGGQ